MDVIRKNYALLLVLLLLQSCSIKTNYIAKFCTGYDMITYISKEYNVYDRYGNIDTDNPVLIKDYYEKYVKYKGIYNFIIFKNINDTSVINGYKLKKYPSYYTIDNIDYDGHINRYFIKNTGVLFKIKYFIKLKGKDNFSGAVIETNACGGYLGLE